MRFPIDVKWSKFSDFRIGREANLCRFVVFGAISEEDGADDSTRVGSDVPVPQPLTK